VEDVLVREGDPVRKGQVLARFSTTSLAPQAASLEAQRRVAAADYERMKNLFAEGAVSQKDVENAELALRSAEAGAALATKRLQEATLRAAEAGVIGRRLVDAGSRVKDGDQLFQLVNTDYLEFEATVPAQFVGDVRLGSPVALVVTGLDGRGVSGKVSRVNAAADPATRQVKVYVTVANGEHRMVGGLFASGRIVLKEARGAVAIPQAGIKTDDAGKNYVLIIEHNRVARRDVTVGIYDEARGMSEITAGLAGGESVIVGPVEGLRVGDQIQLVGREG
jgi:RND family efflux transporter MFP subunit